MNSWSSWEWNWTKISKLLKREQIKSNFWSKTKTGKFKV